MKRKKLIITVLVLAFGVLVYADVGFKAPSIYGHTNTAPLNPGSPDTGAIILDPQSSTFYGNAGTSSSPNWVAMTPPSQNYASGYFDSNYQWSVAATSSYGAFGNSTSGTFYSSFANGLTVTEPFSHGMGITFTPASSSAAYRITFKSTCSSTASTNIGFRLYDSANSIKVNEIWLDPPTSYWQQVLLTGIYVPGTTSSITVLVQGEANSSVTITCGQTFGRANATWDIQKID